MARITKKDYESLAQKVADDYFDNGVSLTDGVLKIAEDKGMAPAQVRQLTWQANTKVHLALFDKKAEDKNIEFDLGDADAVLEQIYSDVKPTEKEAQAREPSLDWSDFYGDLSVMEKAASDKESVLPDDKVTNEALNYSRHVALIRKVASELESRVLQSQIAYDESVQGINETTRRIQNHPDYDQRKFAQVRLDLQSRHGEEILPVLGDLRGWGSDSDFPVTKRASCQVVDDTDELFKRVEQAKEHFDDAVKCAHALNKLRGMVANIL